MPEVDITELIKRLTSYSEVLGRHMTTIQSAFDKMQESFDYLKSVWHGDAAEDFYAQWAQTTARIERTLETGRQIKILLDERLEFLRAADRAMGGGYAGSPQQLGIRFPLSPSDERDWDTAQGYLRALRRRDGIPLFDEPGGDGFTRARFDMGGRSFDGFSNGKKRSEIIDPPPPGVLPNVMRHAEGHAIGQAMREGVTARIATLHVDQRPCPWCKSAFPHLARWLGVEKLRVFTPDGLFGEY